MDALLKYWPVLATLVNFFLAWIAWSMRQLARTEVDRLIAAAVAKLEGADEKTDEDLDALDTRMTKVEGSIAGIGKDIAALPTKADLARVEGEMKGQTALLEAIDRRNSRMEQLFIEQGVRS